MSTAPMSGPAATATRRPGGCPAPRTFPRAMHRGHLLRRAPTADTGQRLGQPLFSMYTNDQPTTTLWFHDHSLGITRLNVYAAVGRLLADPYRDRRRDRSGLGHPAGSGPAGAGRRLTPAAPARERDPRDPDRHPAQVLQRGRLASSIRPTAPSSRGWAPGQTFADNTDVNIPFLPQPTSDIAPVWNPEAFFNTMVVNGNTWPVLEVAPERYRFRVAERRGLPLPESVAVTWCAQRQAQVCSSCPSTRSAQSRDCCPRWCASRPVSPRPLPGDGRDVCPDLARRLAQRVAQAAAPRNGPAYCRCRDLRRAGPADGSRGARGRDRRLQPAAGAAPWCA